MTEKTKISIISILKWGIIVLIAFLISLNFRGQKTSNTSIDKMEKAVISNADMDMMQKGNNQMIKRLYGLNPDDYSGIILYYPKTNMGSEELLLVKLKSIDQQEKVKSAIDSRLKTQKNNFDGYGTYQAGMLDKSIIEVKGNYILFISGNKPEKVISDFLNTL